MIGPRRYALAIALLAITPGTTRAQSSWCEFRPGTLAAIIAIFRGDVVDSLKPGQHNVGFSATTRATRVAVIYLGASRVLPPADSTFLDNYFFKLHRIASDSAFRGLFHQELRFAEGADTLWLPVQDSLIPALRQEARSGDRVTLFARWLGLHQEGPAATWMFVVNEFATASSDSSWNAFLSSHCGPS